MGESVSMKKEEDVQSPLEEMGLEKTRIESKGKKSGVAPVMRDVEPGLGVRNLFQDSVSG